MKMLLPEIGLTSRYPSGAAAVNLARFLLGPHHGASIMVPDWSRMRMCAAAAGISSEGMNETGRPDIPLHCEAAFIALLQMVLLVTSFLS
jgi:hypothetical protein